MRTIKTDDPLAIAVVSAIREGKIDDLKRLLAEHSELATASLGDSAEKCRAGGTARSLLHIATDWPGHFPNGPQIVKILVAAGADVNARFVGSHEETPLHWAASSDDVAVLDALLDHGADIEARGAVIGGGTPLADATAFGQWNAAKRLIERGAQATLWEASALGLMDRIESHYASESTPGRDDVTHAFWGACHGGQRKAAEYLLKRGAEINWIGYDQLTPLDAARRSGAHALAAWLAEQGAKSAEELRRPPDSNST